MNSVPRFPTKTAHFKSKKYTFCLSVCIRCVVLSVIFDSTPRPCDVSGGRTCSQISGSQTPNDLTRLRRQRSYILASYMQKGRRRRCVIRSVMGHSAGLARVCSAETPPWRRQRRSLAAAPKHSYSMQRNPALVSPATHSHHCSASTLQIMDHLPECFCWHRCLWYGNKLSCLAWKVIYRPYSNKYVNFRARSPIIMNKTIQKKDAKMKGENCSHFLAFHTSRGDPRVPQRTGRTRP